MESARKLTAIIVDDERGSINNLRHHLERLCPDIEIAATGSSLQETITAAQPLKIDLAFLDIELFDTNIFNELQLAGTVPFKIVFVTAYEKYALKALKVEALDYILKPLSEDDILVTYTKIKKHFLHLSLDNAMNEQSQADSQGKKIILKHGDQVFIIKSDDIYYLTGNGFYTTITFVFNDEVKAIVTSKPMNKIVSEQDSPMFFRVHKSYIVNTARISEIKKGEQVNLRMADNKLIPVAKRRVNEFFSHLNKN